MLHPCKAVLPGIFFQGVDLSAFLIIVQPQVADQDLGERLGPVCKGAWFEHHGYPGRDEESSVAAVTQQPPSSDLPATVSWVLKLQGSVA